MDLAEALRLKTPLDQALDLIAQGHERVNLPFNPLTATFWPIYVRPDAMAKLLASYLLPHVRQGMSLSMVMSRQKKSFSRQEILIVEMGENHGRLPAALKRLADYRQTDMRLQQIHGRLMYPASIATIACIIISFILIWIIPKFQDMFAQLGGELPSPMQIIIQLSRILSSLGTFVPLLVVAILGYHFMSSMIIRITGVPFPFYLPFVGGLYRTVRDSRWMAAFTLSLEAGETADQALQQAGAICGGTLERRSREAARLVAGGCSIGEACIRCKVLDRWINHRLQLIDWRGNFIEGMRVIVEDADRHVTASMARLGQRIEVLSVFVVGIAIGGLVLSMYMPLFMIPKMVFSYYR